MVVALWSCLVGNISEEQLRWSFVCVVDREKERQRQVHEFWPNSRTSREENNKHPLETLVRIDVTAAHQSTPPSGSAKPPKVAPD